MFSYFNATHVTIYYIHCYGTGIRQILQGGQVSTRKYILYVISERSSKNEKYFHCNLT